eukprot:4671216-Amphidinium_carterae.3
MAGYSTPPSASARSTARQPALEPAHITERPRVPVSVATQCGDWRVSNEGSQQRKGRREWLVIWALDQSTHLLNLGQVFDVHKAVYQSAIGVHTSGAYEREGGAHRIVAQSSPQGSV